MSKISVGFSLRKKYIHKVEVDELTGAKTFVPNGWVHEVINKNSYIKLFNNNFDILLDIGKESPTAFVILMKIAKKLRHGSVKVIIKHREFKEYPSSTFFLSLKILRKHGVLKKEITGYEIDPNVLFRGKRLPIPINKENPSPCRKGHPS